MKKCYDITTENKIRIFILRILKIYSPRDKFWHSDAFFWAISLVSVKTNSFSLKYINSFLGYSDRSMYCHPLGERI